MRGIALSGTVLSSVRCHRGSGAITKSKIYMILWGDCDNSQVDFLKNK